MVGLCIWTAPLSRIPDSVLVGDGPVPAEWDRPGEPNGEQ